MWRRILALGLIVGLGTAAAVADTSGSCSIRAGRTNSELLFRWSRGDCPAGDRCNEGDSDMQWGRWSGVTPSDLQREGVTVDARMKADAGEIRCMGTVHEAVLQGAYSFTPSAQFAREMEALGFENQTPERLQNYAMLGVTTAWVKEMQDAGGREITAGDLMALRALKVDPTYVRGMAAAGYPELKAERLISMKAVGVSPEKVQQLRAMGYSPTEEEMIQMGVLKIDASFVARMKARGLQNLTIRKLIQIRIFKLAD
ncbi:MAG TPA: hypothetical protein VHX11_09055 [Acidobacteriaceae bacterium]|nr:hypothetical protein [Acidobacteriaceae bacterium]